MAKRGRPKKKTFQQLLRERMQQSFEEAVEKQRPKQVKEPRKDSDDPFERRDAIAIEKRHAREKKYRKTHKTRNPETTKKYQQNWLEKFKQEHGMCYSTYMYKVKNGLMEKFK
ncbi:hypothetical protein [Fibrobacter succinogenes]|uniref:hypothetical protein n=1 Tax=Fibrobacter succinogenes TaxID=833 RepID=UPI00156316F5|nr:hypothetical protein [Fibrobacter succinogenes]